MATATAPKPELSPIQEKKGWLLARKGDVAKFVPTAYRAGYDVEKQIRQFMLEAQRNPDLLNCTKESILTAIAQVASVGLEFGSVYGHAYPVPFGNVCQAIIGYRGLIYSAYRCGAVKVLRYEHVCEGDEFQVTLGTDPNIHHVPNYENRGPSIAFYSVAVLPNDEEIFVVMTRSQVDAVRKRSRAANKGPWVTDFDEMGLKTVVRRLQKRLPMSSDDQRASHLRLVAADERAEELGGGVEDVSAVLGIDMPGGEQEPPAKKATAAIDAALEGDDFDPSESAKLDAELAGN